MKEPLPKSSQQSTPQKSAPIEPPEEHLHILRYDRNVGKNRQYTTILLYVLLGIAFTAVCIYFLINRQQLVEVLDTLGGIAAPILIGIAIAYLLHPLTVFFEDHLFASAARHQYNRARRRLLKAKLAYDHLRRAEASSQEALDAALSELSFAKTALAEGKASLQEEADQKRLALENKLNKRQKPSFQKKTVKHAPHPRRLPAMICTYLLVFLLLAIFAWIVVPQCISGLSNFVRLIRYYAETLPMQLQNLRLPETLSGLISSEALNENLLELGTYVFNFLSEFLMGVLTKLPDFIVSTISSVTNLVLGVFLSVYFLASRETLLSQLSRASDAIFGKKIHKGILYVARRTHQTFGAFIRGKLIDSLLMMVICFTFFSIAGIPYAAMITLITVVTNLIPYFGPFIGAIPSGIIILLAAPPKLILFILLILVIQQIEGGIIEPRILGHTMGMAPVWIIVAILIMGELFGLAGMILGVPVFSVLYSLLAEFCQKRLRKKKAHPKVPSDSEGN